MGTWLIDLVATSGSYALRQTNQHNKALKSHTAC